MLGQRSTWHLVRPSRKSIDLGNHVACHPAVVALHSWLDQCQKQTSAIAQVLSVSPFYYLLAQQTLCYPEGGEEEDDPRTEQGQIPARQTSHCFKGAQGIRSNDGEKQVWVLGQYSPMPAPTPTRSPPRANQSQALPFASPENSLLPRSAPACRTSHPCPRKGLLLSCGADGPWSSGADR